MKNLLHKYAPEINTNQNIFTDGSILLMYATDASAYKEIPFSVFYPGDSGEIRKLVLYALENRQGIIPRGAGTSLAGQVVGKGIIADISRKMNRILEVNASERWVRLQPGVVLDELNLFLKPHSLFFAPETSTSNRCVIGGMVGNNSSGLHSLLYGTTREHLLSVKAVLSDGSEAEFGPLDMDEFKAKTRLNSLEGELYRQIEKLLSSEQNRAKIRNEFPAPGVVRRNTGYALDELMDSSVFDPESERKFNFCKLLAGSEGTLAFITEIKLSLTELPPSHKALICAHFETVDQAILANLIALSHKPGAVELMDDKILELTKANIEQRKNRFFVQGNPGAILIIEFARENLEEIQKIHQELVKDFEKEGLGYHFPMISGSDIKKVWELRKAGLGVLSNMPGDARPVSVIEDTSVEPARLAPYIAEFRGILQAYGLECVYHAHISVGELHLRPILNLKDQADVEVFRKIAEDTARLVKKYKGSLSGEHGDGRLRGEFIPIMVGEEIYQWFRDIKNTWDPNGVFNPNKIVDTPPMNGNLRYIPGMPTPEIPTVFDFSAEGGIVRAAEKCNGSGDCRKSALMGGTMCPSYMASLTEETTTRARANILREFISKPGQLKPFNHREIYDVMDLCLSCKACKAECPSNVDMAKLKAEFLQHYHDENGIPLRTRMIAYIQVFNRIGSVFPVLYNKILSAKFSSGLIKKMAGFALPRSIPAISRKSLHRWLKSNLVKLNSPKKEDAPELFLFVDEFTDYNDTSAGIKFIKLISALGYRIRFVKSPGSGRSFISKGLLRTARKLAARNILIFKDRVNAGVPLVGLEPSAVLAFRDEYPDFFYGEMKNAARMLSKNVLTAEEFMEREIKAGRIAKDNFSQEEKLIKLHGHCQQKAVASTDATKTVLSLPGNYRVEEIPSGCCGMAGSFGYEKEHYDLSMKIGELVLFPAVRNSGKDTIISAPGTSCRHQIYDGTGKKALHPVEVLYDAFNWDSAEFEWIKNL